MCLQMLVNEAKKPAKLKQHWFTMWAEQKSENKPARKHSEPRESTQSFLSGGSTDAKSHT